MTNRIFQLVLKCGWMNGLLTIVQFLLVIAVTFLLRKTIAFYSVYVLLSSLGLLSLMDNVQALFRNGGRDDRLGDLRQRLLMAGWAVFLGACVALAEYAIPCRMESAICKMGLFAMIFSGVFACGWNMAKCAFARLRFFTYVPGERPCLSVASVFWFSFLLLLLIYLSYLFGARYPGTLSPDSCCQLLQVVGTHELHNHHPVCHTGLIAVLFHLGRFLSGGDNNVGVAFYSVFQCFLMAGSFAYLIATLYRFGGGLLAVNVLLAWFGLHPYHVFYSSVMWKNVVFASAAVIFLTALFRIGHGWRRKPEYVALTISALMFCLFLTNGFGAFILSLPVMIFAFWRIDRRVVLILILAGCSAGLIKYPIFGLLKIRQHNAFEPYAVPTQQIARVLYDNKEVSAEDRRLLELLSPVPSIVGKYWSNGVDPIKWMVCKNEASFQLHKREFAQLWLRLGYKYPVSYLKAWIDETCAYWNGGYRPYWKLQFAGKPDFPDVYGPNPAGRGFVWASKYEDAFIRWPVLQPAMSLGLHFWIIVFCLVLAIFRRSWVFALSVPLLFLALTLMAAAPINNEFRYFYALFACSPLCLFASLIKTGSADEMA